MASIDFDIEDYLDEADTDYLVNELISRKILPTHFKFKDNETDLTCWGKYPKRDALIQHLDLSPLADMEDIMEKIKEIYYK